MRERSSLRKAIALLLIGMLASSSIPAQKVNKGQAMYVGGTIAGLSEGTIGRLETASDKVLVFESPNGKFEIPYEHITTLEYGQKAGRRLGAALGWTVLMGPLFLFTLFSKKRKHFLSIGFTDANDRPQGVVIEVPKGTAKSTITILEVRSGKKVEYESEEARKHVHG